MFYKMCIHLVTLYHFFIQVKTWNVGDYRNLFLKLNTQNWDSLMLYLQLQKLLPTKLKLTVVEMQQLPDNEKTDSQEETSCLKWTI